MTRGWTSLRSSLLTGELTAYKKAAAKAFTGWGVDNDTGKFIIRTDQHVAGQSTFLGKTGDFSGDDILNILLAHPRTAERLVDKIWL